MWTFIAEVTGTSAGGQFEYSFPLSALGNPSSLQIASVGSNEAYNGGTTEDHYPDGVYDSSSTNRFFTHTVSTPINSAPVIADLSTVVTEGQTVDVLLTATDADSDPLTYAVATQPANGALQGTPPALVYTPNPGFSGADSFSYRGNDGNSDSGAATVRILVRPAIDAAIPSNPVTSITLDGNLQEWAALQSFDDDLADITGNDNPVDHLTSSMAHDARLGV